MQISQFFFKAALLILILVGTALILNHQGVALRLLIVNLVVLFVGTLFYLGEVKTKNER